MQVQVPSLNVPQLVKCLVGKCDAIVAAINSVNETLPNIRRRAGSRQTRQVYKETQVIPAMLKQFHS